jgi:hypothetical protein
MNKLLITASALVLGMALSGVALADADSGAVALSPLGKATSTATHTGDTNFSLTSNKNSSSTATVNTSANLSDNYSKTEDSHNTYNSSKSSTNNFSLNDSKTDTKIDDSYNNESKTFNNSTSLTVNANAALSLQSLNNAVTGVKVSFGDGEGGSGAVGGAGTANLVSNLSTGDVNSSGANDFSGIQTANYDTGFGSGVQGAASLAATSSISFNDSHQ